MSAATDIRRQMSLDVHHAHKKQVPVDDDHRIEIRFMRPEESEGLSRCVFRSYGGSYDADWIYQPDTIAERINAGLYRSVIGLSDGEIVGHIGLTIEHVDSKVGEAGQAVVDSRFRGHHLFTSLKKFLADWCTSQGLYGIFSEATAAHPYSQKANLQLNACETGILLSYIPGSVEYKDIATQGSGRSSVVLFYLRTNSGHTRPVYAPKEFRPIVRQIIQNSSLSGVLESSNENNKDQIALAPKSSWHVSRRPSHNHLLITLKSYGEDFYGSLAELITNEAGRDVFCSYLDLPLNDPLTARLGRVPAKLGFFFGGIFPNRLVDGDVLRLQRLAHPQHGSDIKTASEFGNKLLQFIIADQARTTGEKA